MDQPNPGSTYYRDKSGREYFEGYQDRLARGGTFLNVPLYRRFVEPMDTVLDFACGSGELLSLLTARRKLGVDVNPLAVEAARARGIEMFANLQEVPSSSIDVIISNHGLEHTLRPYDVLADLRRCTRPGGRLVLYLPADSWFKQRSSRMADPNHHLYTWTPLLLANLLQEAGWHVAYSRLKFHAWPPRGYTALRYVPTPVAQAVCSMMGVLLLQPQIHAFATN